MRGWRMLAMPLLQPPPFRALIQLSQNSSGSISAQDHIQVMFFSPGSPHCTLPNSDHKEASSDTVSTYFTDEVKTPIQLQLWSLTKC